MENLKQNQLQDEVSLKSVRVVNRTVNNNILTEAKLFEYSDGYSEMRVYKYQLTRVGGVTIVPMEIIEDLEDNDAMSEV